MRGDWGMILWGSVLLGACAPAGVTVDPAPAPEPMVDPRDAEPPELTLAERRAAPFAVVSAGGPVERGDRPSTPGDGGGAVTRTTGTRVPASGSVETGGAVAERRSAAAANDEPADAAGGEAVRARAAGRAGPGAAEAARTHRVAWGETWFGIARRYGVSRDELAAANPGVDPERLRAGEVLTIPASGREIRTHTVVAGDSLWGIACRYRVTIEAIREANGLDGDRVRIGQELVIPGR